tara:strand:+ start:319 stop:714 length:396 start_codon:yes stop_codon:yes gene_type:complete
MKKLIALLVIAGSFTAAQATTWVPNFKSTNPTTGIVTSINVDISTITWSNPTRDTIQAWIKEVRTDGTQTLTRRETHCPSGMVRFLNSYSYYTYGSDSPYASNDYPTAWAQTIPNSKGDGLNNYVCNFYAK